MAVQETYYRFHYEWIDGNQVLVWQNGRVYPWKSTEFFLGSDIFYTFTKVEMSQQNRFTEIKPPLLSGTEYDPRGIEKRSWSINGLFLDFKGVTAQEWVKRLEKACNIPSWVFFVYPKMYTERVVVKDYKYSEIAEDRVYEEKAKNKPFKTVFDFSINIEQAREFPEVKVPAARATVPTGDDKQKTIAPKTHTVVSGDTLWGIAVKYYGDGKKYTIIFDANKNNPAPNGITNANKIYPGQKFTIPVL